MTIKAYIQKELIEHHRRFRLLILLVLSLLFAFTAPVILYFLPKILASQANSNMDLTSLFTLGQTTAIINYMNDMFEIPGLIMIIFGANLVYKEFKPQAITIPFANGMSFSSMILTKFFVYIGLIALITFFSFIINHYYSGLVFNEFYAYMSDTLHGWLSFVIYVAFHVALAICVLIYSRSLFASLSVAIASYFILPNLVKFFDLSYSPYNLLFNLNLTPWTVSSIINMVITSIIIVGLLLVSMKKKFELWR